MTDEGQAMFHVNELIAIHTALQSQIDDCEDFLKDPSIPQSAKPQITKNLEYSKSALARLDAIFAESNINPERIE